MGILSIRKNDEKERNVSPLAVCNDRRAERFAKNVRTRGAVSPGAIFRSLGVADALKGEEVLKSSLLLNGLTKSAAVAVVLLGVASVAQAQPGPGKGGAAVKQSVVGGYATETIPATNKKYVGTFDPIQSVDSVARVAGDLTVAPGFEEGATVTKGQLLFEIDPIRYEAKVKAAEATIRQMEARVAYAQTNEKRLQDLFDRNAGSKDDLEKAQSELESFKAQLEEAKAQLILAQDDLKYTKIYAMIDGRVGRFTYTSGNYVSATSQPLVTTVQVNPIYVKFSMSERDFTSMFGNLDALKNYSTIRLKLANDEIYDEPGEITFINNEVKTTTDAVSVWATFQNDAGLLNPGGIATVLLTKRDPEATAAVKPSAVMFDAKGYFAYALVDELSDDELFEEIKKDARFAADVAAVEKGEKTKDAYLAEFKTRYEVKDPKTGEVVGYDFKDGKVLDPDCKLVVRRDLEVGPIDGDVQAIYSGVKPGDLIVMDGTNKVKPFELARPIWRDNPEANEPKTKKSTESENSAAKTATKPAKTPKTEAKRIDSKKNKKSFAATARGAFERLAALATGTRGASAETQGVAE